MSLEQEQDFVTFQFLLQVGSVEFTTDLRIPFIEELQIITQILSLLKLLSLDLTYSKLSTVRFQNDQIGKIEMAFSPLYFFPSNKTLAIIT